MFCCTVLYVHSSIAIILMRKRELIALLNLSSWCLVMVERLFLAVPRGCLRFVIVVFPDHTHLLFLKARYESNSVEPDQTPRSDLVINCLPMSHKKDTRLIWVNSLHDGYIFKLLLSSAMFSKLTVSKKKFRLSNWIQIRTDSLSVLISVQPVCRCYQQGKVP